MYTVLTEKRTNVVVAIGEGPGEAVEGGLLLETTIYPTLLNLVINEVDEVSEEIVPHKYCYAPDRGFYSNPNYIPTDEENEQRFQALQQENLLALEGIATLYEMLLTGGDPQ